MESYGTLESLLVYRPPDVEEIVAPMDGGNGADGAEPLENLLEEKVKSLSSILGQILEGIRQRSALSSAVQYRIDQNYWYLKAKLFELYTWEFGRNRSIELRRSGLEKQLDALNQEKRREQVQCWQDIESLKKEFRNWFKQYSDLVQRVGIIFPKKIRRGKQKVVENEAQQIWQRIEGSWQSQG